MGGFLQASFPAALLLLFAGWAGTFAGAAEGWGALVGHSALVWCLVAAGRFWRDPLGLGARGGVLLVAFMVSIAASLLRSPVPRAGLLTVLVPAALLVPRAVAGAWADARRRRIGLRMVSLVVAGIAVWSLVVSWRLGTAAALPLGHHNLLSGWLVALLPIAVVPWRDGGAWRLVACTAGGLGLASLLATRSLAAAVAVTAVAVAVAARRRRGRLAVLAAALAAGLLLASQAPRLARLADDTSLRARMGYLAAGWRGFLQRPVFGWGPGATAWTISEHLRPSPGIHPADEVVADLHSLPLQVAYELGASGLLLASGLALGFWSRRRRETAADPELRGAAVLGLGALAVLSVAGLPLAVTALPVTALVAAGAALAAGGRSDAAGGRWPSLVAAAAIAAVVLPLDLAHLAYDRGAAASDPAEQARQLRSAVRLDRAFPLYRARLAWLDGEIGKPDRSIARRARAAARDAWGVAPLWLVAGILAQQTGEPGGREALLRACRLSPLAAMAPFRLAVGEPAEERTAEWGARAILAEPRLAAAVGWDDRQEFLAAAVVRAAREEGIEPGWRLRLIALFGQGLELAGPIRAIVLEMDGESSTSLSLHAFRRRPWPAELARVELSTAALQRIDLVPASGQPTTASELWTQSLACGLGQHAD